MVDNLELIDPTRFIRSFWNSRHQFVRDRYLYKSLRKRYTKSSDVEKLMTDLNEQSSLFKSLVNPELNPSTNRKINEKFLQLYAISSSTFYPLVLAVENNVTYDESDLDEILQSVIVYYVRNILVAGGSPNSTEVFFSDLALKVFDNTENIRLDICKKIMIKQLMMMNS